MSIIARPSVASLAVALTLTQLAASEKESIPQPAAPVVAAPDQKFLTWVARRALEEAVARRPAPQLTYRPASLAELSCPMAVTLRLGGFERGLGISPKLPACDAAREAAILAFQDAGRREKLTASQLAKVTLEMEVIGEVLPAPTIPSWSSAQSFRFMQRGVHGLTLNFMEAQTAIRPSEFIADNRPFREAVEIFANRANPGGEAVDARFVSWFRTAHWHELEPGGEVVELRRGLVVVPPEAVTQELLSKSIAAIVEFMLYRQRPGGEFAYQYDPSTDVYQEETSDVRQAGCAWTLAQLAGITGFQPVISQAKEVQAASKRTLDSLKPRIVGLEGVENAAFLRAAQGPSKLGATALLCLALSEQSETGEWHAIRDRLVTAMLWLQRPDGRFITVFPPSLEDAGQDHAPGQALLALARAHQDEPRDEIAKAFDAARPFYRDYFRKSPSAALAAWQAMAFSRMAALTRRREHAEFAFELADWLASRQLGPRNCDWPDLWGGVDAFGDGDVGALTATGLEALADALALARDLNDQARIGRYESAVRAAARFVVQLQFRREEAFYARSLRDCVGGIRAAPWDNRIRIEQCAHALRALVRARDMLFSAPPTPPSPSAAARSPAGAACPGHSPAAGR